MLNLVLYKVELALGKTPPPGAPASFVKWRKSLLCLTSWACDGPTCEHVFEKNIVL